MPGPRGLVIRTRGETTNQRLPKAYALRLRELQDLIDVV